MDRTPELLFNYLRDLIYAPQKAALDVEQLAPDYKKLGLGLISFARLLNEQRAFAVALGRGELTVTPPGRENELAAPLKALQASLRHMTWQSQQVAKGDYQQRVDFMGEFSQAFNAMTQQLEARQRALEAEIEAGRQKANALEQSNRLLTSVTMGISQALFVLGTGSEILYQNGAAENVLADPAVLPAAIASLSCILDVPDRQENEFTVGEGGAARTYTIHYYTIQWSHQEATACVLNDISEEKARLQELENKAYQDAMTGLYNRFYGMQMLADWLDQARRFSLCFIDLDNLKYVNDTYGHHEGDHYINTTADLLRTIGKGTIACRIGGDEFMLLCPECTLALTEEMVDSVRKQLQRRIHAQNKPYSVNISFGVVEADGAVIQTAGELLSLADERMYAHKRSQKQQRRTR